MLIVFSFSQTTWLERFLNNRVSAFLGRMSLAVYLNQVIMFNVYFAVFDVQEDFHAALAISLGFVLVGSGAILGLVEILKKARGKHVRH